MQFPAKFFSGEMRKIKYLSREPGKFPEKNKYFSKKMFLIFSPNKAIISKNFFEIFFLQKKKGYFS